MADLQPQDQRLSLFAAAYTACLCVFFGANAVAIKVSLAGLGVFTTAGLRFSIASVAIFIWATVTRRSLKIRQGQMRHLLIITVIFVVQLSCFYLGLSKTNASRGTLLVNLQPFLLLFLAHCFIPGDRMTGRKFMGLLLGFSGVVFVFLEKKGVTTDLQIGDLIMLTTAFIWACNAVYVKRIISTFEPFHIVLYPMIFSVPLFFMAGFLWDRIMIGQVDTRIMIALLYQSLITASFGFIAWNTLLRKYGAVSLHSFLFIMPVSGVLLGGLLLNEPVTFKILVALLLIASGILVVHSQPKKQPALISLPRNV